MSFNINGVPIPPTTIYFPAREIFYLSPNNPDATIITLGEYPDTRDFSPLFRINNIDSGMTKLHIRVTFLRTSAATGGSEQPNESNGAVNAIYNVIADPYPMFLTTNLSGFDRTAGINPIIGSGLSENLPIGISTLRIVNMANNTFTFVTTQWRDNDANYVANLLTIEAIIMSDVTTSLQILCDTNFDSYVMVEYLSAKITNTISSI
jgi:hypothetical protein